MSAVVINLLRNNKDDTVSIYPHERRPDAVVVKHRYSENVETDTLLVVKKDDLPRYFDVLFDYVFAVMRGKASKSVADPFKRIRVTCPGLPHFETDITDDTVLGDIREITESMVEFISIHGIQPWPLTVPRADDNTQPPVVVRQNTRGNGGNKKDSTVVETETAPTTVSE
jgi:hypothetical protein